MAILADRVDERSDAYRANRAALQALIDQHDERLAQLLVGGGQQYVDRHRKRGKLLAALFFPSNVAKLSFSQASVESVKRPVRQRLWRWLAEDRSHEWLLVGGVLVAIAAVVVGIVLSKYPGDWGAVLAALNNVTVLINPLLPVALRCGI